VRRQFGKTILELGRKDPKLLLIYGDVFQNMEAFRAEFPNRILNAGICEQSMVGMAAGLALEGWHPVLYSLTPFLLERAYEQWKMDVDVQNVPVIGVGYSSYPTHGPSQTPLNPRMLCSAFKNIRFSEPVDSFNTEVALLLAHDRAVALGEPAFISLTRDNNVK